MLKMKLLPSTTSKGYGWRIRTTYPPVSISEAERSSWWSKIHLCRIKSNPHNCCTHAGNGCGDCWFLNFHISSFLYIQCSSFVHKWGIEEFSLHPSVKTPAFLFSLASLFWITQKWWVFLYIHAKYREQMGQTPKWLAADLSSGQQLRCFEVSPCPLERLAAKVSERNDFHQDLLLQNV